jgi:hypothetical protein
MNIVLWENQKRLLRNPKRWEKMAVTEWDEYLIHQLVDTIDRVESDDPHFADRFFFTCHNAEGTLELMAGLGAYPNVNVMDGFVCVRHNGVQRNIRLSRHLQGDRAKTEVGPLCFKVLEPLRRWGIYLGDNDYGIGCSLEFEGRVAPYLHGDPSGRSERPPEFMAHYTQEGWYTGSITFEGRQFKVDRFLGPRDRSWGVRRPSGVGAELDPRACIYLWIHAQFSSFSLVLIYIELAEGAFHVCTGAILNDDESVIPVVDMRHRIEFIPGVRAYNKMEMLLKDSNGGERHVIAKPISHVAYMSGGGYDGRHGVDRGPFHVEGERWDVSGPLDVKSPLFGAYTQPNHREAEFQLDGELGVGLLESGFSPVETWQYKPSW